MSYAVELLAEHSSWELALRSATTGSAVALGLGSSIGRVVPGFDADLLVLGADPRRDPAALRDVRAVYRHGTRVVG